MAKAFAADWPQLKFDAQRTSYNPNEKMIGPTTVGDLEVLWTNSVSSTIRGCVSVANDIVYYGLYGEEFRAVDADTGSRLWTNGLSGKHAGQSVFDGVAYVTSIKKVYAFDALTGGTLWTWDVGSSDVGSPLVADGVLYVNAAGSLHALDTATGDEIWSISPGGGVAVDDGIVYVCNSDLASLRTIDPENGDLLWTGITGEGSLAGPVVANGLVYIHSNVGYLYAFDASGCAEEICSPLWGGETPLVDDHQNPAVADGKLYMGSNGTFYAFDANGCEGSECSPLWVTETSCSSFDHPPSVANGVVYTTCGNSYLYAFDASTGDILWQYYTAGTGYPMRSQPTIVNGRLYHAATFDFRLYAFYLDCVDMDGDGYADEACGGTDCDDSDPEVNPGVDEVCDEIDWNCSGDPFDKDADGDGHFDDDPVCMGEDCDDSDPDTYPGAEEICDGKDNNCDDLVPVDERIDEDLDGWLFCADCDDRAPDVNPGVGEVCDNEIDDDCDGLIDCEDSDCLDVISEDCTDGFDNDCDGIVDFDDPDCEFTLEVDASYWAGELSLDVTIGTPVPASWVNYLILTYPETQVIPLWTMPLPVIAPPISFPCSFPFPGGLSWIGIWTGLFTEGDAQAVYYEQAYTGWPSP